jgi:predicted nucleotidyltransferase
MPIPSPLQLDNFERAIQADPEVLGMFYFGSLGRGAATRHSDLDIFVVVPDSMTEPYQQKLVPLLQLFGEIHWLEIPKGTGYVGPNWNQVDIEFEQRSKLQPSYRYAGATVIKDQDGFMAAYAASCTPEEIVETPASAGAVIHEAIGDLLYQARNNARGALWESRGNITYQCSLVYQLLGRLRGRRTYGFRYVEELLTPDEQALLTAAWPREPTRAENRRAARALWVWTRYVWREAERVIGAPLEVEVDEEGMLAAIDRMYEGTEHET